MSDGPPPLGLATGSATVATARPRGRLRPGGQALAAGLREPAGYLAVSRAQRGAELLRRIGAVALRHDSLNFSGAWVTSTGIAGIGPSAAQRLGDLAGLQELMAAVARLNRLQLP